MSATPASGSAAVLADRAVAENRCREGSAPACGALGRMLVGGGSDRDFERGVVLLEVACGAADQRACTVLGTIYAKRPKQDRSVERGREMLERACAARVPEACTGVGEVLATGAKGNREARQHLRTGCELGDPRGCELLGLAELDDELDGDGGRAEVAFAMGCHMGRRSSCHELALRSWRDPARRRQGVAMLIDNCQRGSGPSCLEVALLAAPLLSGDPSCAKAEPFAGRACGLGTVAGCVLIAACAAEGSPGNAQAEQKRDRMVNRLYEACQARDPLACLYWGDVRERKSTAPADRQKIRQAYAIACKGDSRFAAVGCAREAAIELEEASEQSEATQPLELLQQSCDRSVVTACCALAQQHERGKWVKADANRATELRQKVCAGEVTACCPAPAAREPR